MSSKKVTELSTLFQSDGIDLLYIIDNPFGTPEGKQISLNSLFGNVPSNTNVLGTFTANQTSILKKKSILKWANTSISLTDANSGRFLVLTNNSGNTNVVLSSSCTPGSNWTVQKTGYLHDVNITVTGSAVIQSSVDSNLKFNGNYSVVNFVCTDNTSGNNAVFAVYGDIIDRV